MKLAINALFKPDGGSLTSLRGLLEDWRQTGVFGEHEITLFVSPDAIRSLEDCADRDLNVVQVSVAGRGATGRLRAEQFVLPALLRKCGSDVLYCPANTMPLKSDVPCVVTFQNAAPFDPVMKRYAVGTGTRLRWLVLRQLAIQSARRAEHIICLSEYFREVLGKFASVSDDRCSVIPRTPDIDQPADAAASELQIPGLRPPFVLTVGHIYPYRNYLQLAQAMQTIWQQADRKWQLVIVGDGGIFPAYTDRLQTKLKELDPAGENILLTGRLDHATVQALVRQCDAYAFTSVCENCPTGLMEALAAGRPVLCSDAGVMPEIAGDAALFCETTRTDDVARGLLELTGNAALRRELAGRAIQRAARFPTRQEVARRVLDVLESAGRQFASRPPATMRRAA